MLKSNLIAGRIEIGWIMNIRAERRILQGLAAGVPTPGCDRA
jgi:hypothetical protein